jgi:predicted nuclease with TOPRIM domain
MASDLDIRQHITDLIAEERDLRDRLAKGEISKDEEHEQLRRAEVELDQCWDLLRQRDARREFGENPDEAAVRDAGTVENYRG